MREYIYDAFRNIRVFQEDMTTMNSKTLSIAWHLVTVIYYFILRWLSMGFAVVHGGGSFKLVVSHKLLELAKLYNILS
jgi:hypothetical protein